MEVMTQREMFKKNFLIFVSSVFFVLFFLFKVTTPYMTVASFAYILLFLGIIFHTEKKIHIPLMLSGVIIDLLLVLILELKRSAIATAFGDSLNVYQKGHILFSSTAVALYIPTIIIASYAIFKKSSYKKISLHRSIGRIAFFCRTIGFLLMFSLLEFVKK